MAYTKTVWTDRQVTNPLRFSFTLISGTAGTTGSVYDLIPNEGTISNAGTAINATNLNNIENGIFNLDAQVTTNTSNIATLTSGKVAKNGDTMTGTLTAPQLNTPTLVSTGTLNVSGTSTLSAVTCTQLNATGAGGLQEAGVQLTNKYLQQSGGTITGNLVVNGQTTLTAGGNNLFLKGTAVGTACLSSITVQDSASTAQGQFGKITNGTNDISVVANTGDLLLTTTTGTVKVNDDLIVNGNETINGNLQITSTSTSPFILTSPITTGADSMIKFSATASYNYLQLSNAGQTAPKSLKITGQNASVVMDEIYLNALQVKREGDVIARSDYGTRIDNLGATPKVMIATDTVTCSVPIDQCPNGWMLQWRQDSGTAYLHYEPIYKFQSTSSNTMYNCGNNLVGTPLQKVLVHTTTTITGSASNDDNTNINRVLSGVYIF